MTGQSVRERLDEIIETSRLTGDAYLQFLKALDELEALIAEECRKAKLEALEQPGVYNDENALIMERLLAELQPKGEK